MRRTHRLITLLAAGALAACAGTGGPAPSPTAWSDAGTSLETSATVRHMHLHAEQLDKLNAALAAGDLVAAGTPAYWLSRHERLDGIPVHWWATLDEMREAATVVEETRDLAVARAAAARLEQACVSCHHDNEVSVR